MPSEGTSERVLIYSLFGGDAELTSRILSEARIAAHVCADLDALCEGIVVGAGAVILVEEALVPAATSRLLEILDEEPPWSDLPVIVSTTEPSMTRDGYGVVGALGQRVNFTLLDRPVRAQTLLTSVRSALRARRRQYETRGLLERQRELLESEQHARRRVEAESTSKDEFLATVSHELRTPLNAMLGWARMLSGGLLDEQQTRRALDAIERNAVAQAQLIEDLLDVSRIVSGKMLLTLSDVNLTDIVSAAIDSVRPAIEAKQLTFSPTIRCGSARVKGDPNRLQQVVWNLLSNAIKFTPDSGRIEVLLTQEHAHVELTVTDTGQGIEPTFLPYLFQRFTQADGTVTRTHGGLGLGLAISRHLVELHGGTIEAHSAGTGKGATFRFSLPCASRQWAGAAPARLATPVPSAIPFERPSELSGLRVLVVDDEPDARDLLTEVLTHCGAVPVQAGSAAEALALVSTERPDVILSDIGMPIEDGYNLMRRVRALEPAAGGLTPAAALTAYARAEDRRSAMDAGFEMHIAKPVEPAELIKAVAALARLSVAAKQESEPQPR